MHYLKNCILCFLLAAACSCGGGSNGDSPTDPTTPTDPTKDRPTLNGMMTFHSYSSYDANDSKMYIYDFKTGELTQISKESWGIKNPMNGSFSPDGTKIVFMGIGSTGTWDIFMYDVTTGKTPVNLTLSGSYRDEDPKYSFDGKNIAFKRDGKLAEYNIASGNITVLTDDSEERGMPYFSTDGKTLLFSGGSEKNSYIGLYNFSTGKCNILYNRQDVTEYYPITRDAKTFYYTAHYSETSDYDQLYLGYFSGLSATRLPFCTSDADYSDAATVTGNWLILSSTRSGGKGQYDLYIANAENGAIYSMALYNSGINSSLNELGACYNSNNPTIAK
jgi:Tol biopolymer transport system component